MRRISRSTCLCRYRVLEQGEPHTWPGWFSMGGGRFSLWTTGSATNSYSIALQLAISHHHGYSCLELQLSLNPLLRLLQAFCVPSTLVILASSKIPSVDQVLTTGLPTMFCFAALVFLSYLLTGASGLLSFVNPPTSDVDGDFGKVVAYPTGSVIDIKWAGGEDGKAVSIILWQLNQTTGELLDEENDSMEYIIRTTPYSRRCELAPC